MKRQERKFKQRRILNIAVAVCAALILSVMPISMLVGAGANALGNVTLTANLVSPNGGANPFGKAEYKADGSERELEIEVENVAAANGTVLSFFVDGNAVGQTSVNSQKAELRLRTDDGQAVPVINAGSVVQIRNGAAAILNGVFGGSATPSPSVSPSGSPTNSPSPSPTGSPSVSPSVSPSASPTGSPSPSPNGGNLFAALTGATLNGALPNGFAQYEIHSSRTELEIRVRQVNLPIGTALPVAVNNAVVGQLVLESGGEGRLRLRSDNGQTVPVVTANSNIVIRNGGATILSGTFTGGGATPSPSVTPSVSPPASPSVSPSPSASPTPSQGRYFEAHLTGANESAGRHQRDGRSQSFLKSK